MKPITYALLVIAVGLVLFLVFYKKKPESETEYDTGTDSSGEPRGVRNNNPGNIKLKDANDWNGKIPRSENTDGIFEQFKDIQHGARAQMKLLRNYYNGGQDTISKIVLRYHPPVDIQLGVNQSKELVNYINAVASGLGIRNDEKINLNDKSNLVNLAYEMGRFENANHRAITKTLYNQAYNLL